MQSTQGEQWDEHGCFVYKVLQRISVREVLYTDESKYSNTFDIFNPGDQVYEAGDVVSVDMVRPSRVSDSVMGSALRLSDFSGWLFESINKKQMLKKLSIEEGLWSFYIDYTLDDVALKNHPYEGSSNVFPCVIYQSMQILFCDRCLISQHGCRWFRVQGTGGWIVDKDKSGLSILLSASLVRKGLFAYEVMNRINVLRLPDCKSESTPMMIEKYEIICGDMIRECPHASGNGPFVRLTDGSGWLYVRNLIDKKIYLKRVPIEAGSWDVEVKNKPTGLSLRRQPIDQRDEQVLCYLNQRYDTGDIVRCDRKIEAASGVCFYRVVAYNGWLFDRHGRETLLNVKSSGRNHLQRQKTSLSSESWSVELIRGIALANDLHEVDHDPGDYVISFHKDKSIRINVYYVTKSVGTTNLNPLQGKCQLLRRECSLEELVQLLRDPHIQMDKASRMKNSYYEEISYVCNDEGSVIIVENEQGIRQSLLETEQQISNLEMRKKMLTKIIKKHDEKHNNEANGMKSAILARKKEYELVREQSKNSSSTEILIKVEQNGEDNNLIEKQDIFSCDGCSRVFKDRSSRNQHYLDFHLKQDKIKDDQNIQQEMWICLECSRIFKSEIARDQHHRDFHRKQDDMFKCDECSRIFKDEFARDQHFRDFHRKSDEELKRKRMLELTCTDCSRIFKDLHSRDQHYRDFHAKHDKRGELKQNDQKILICLECPQVFNNEIDRVHHYRTSHRNQDDQEQKRMRRDLKCLECTRIFKNQHDREQHFRDFHKSI